MDRCILVYWFLLKYIIYSTPHLNMWGFLFI
jgi:hypothetical protein